MATPSKTATAHPSRRPTTARDPDNLAPSAPMPYDDGMTSPPFDTLRAAARLREEGGFDEVQATAVVTTLADCMNQTLASKADVQRSELAVRSDMEKMEVSIRGDMEKMEVSIRGDMEKMEVSMKAMDASIRSDMQKMEASIRKDMQKMEASIRKDMQKMDAKLDLIAERLENQIAASARKTLLQLGTLVVTLVSVLAALQKMGVL